MNSCRVQENEFQEISRNSVVICPKPRRLGVLNHHSSRSLRWQLIHQMDLCESNSENHILDLIIAKGGYGDEQDEFFKGSPPSRVSNPLTRDSLFKEELVMVAPPSRANKHQPPLNGGGCVRSKNFVNNPVIRVVGFDCDSNRSISTLA